MLRYAKSLPMPEFERKSKTFTDFTQDRRSGQKAQSGALPYDECYNFTCRGSALVAELGCEEEPCEGMRGEAVKAMCVYTHAEKGKGVAYCVEGKVNFAYDDGQSVLTLGAYNFTDPVMLAHSSTDGTQFLLVGGQEGVYSYYNKMLRKVGNLASASAMAWCNERVFVLSAKDKNKLYYSLLTAGNVPAYVPTIEYLSFEPNDGEIEDMAVCSDEVYLLRQNKITRVQCNEWDDGFKTENVSCSFGKPFARSMRCCGGKLVFACEDGIYILSDDTLEKADIAVDLSGVTDETGVYSGVFGRYYFFSYTVQEGERTLFYSPETGEYALTDLAVVLPAKDGEGCLFYRDGALCRLKLKSEACGAYGATIRKTWKSVPTDFSFGTGRKLLRSLTLRGKGKISVTVTSNTGMGGTYVVDLTSGEGRVAPLLRGERFTILLASEDGDCRIEGMDAEADVYANTYNAYREESV